MSHRDLLGDSREHEAILRIPDFDSDTERLHSQQHLAMSVGSLDQQTSGQKTNSYLSVSDNSNVPLTKSENRLNVKSVQTAGNSSVDLSKSLDSILQEATGSDVYNSEWEKQNGSNRMVRSFEADRDRRQMGGITT